MKNTLFKVIFESAPDAVIIVNERGNIIMSNKQAEKLFQYSTEELYGMTIELLMPGSYSEKHKAHRSKYASHPQAREMGNHLEFPAKKKDGSEFYVEISLSPVRIENELFISAAIRDVSERRRMVAQLKKQQSLLITHNNRLMNFAYVVSHDLRSYARNLGIMLSLLEKTGSPHDKEEIMTHLKAISNGLSDTVDHLSEAVSVPSDPNLQEEVINLKNYIDKTIEILIGEINTVGGTIINNVPEETNISYNPAYMESILLNLISNGIKYRHPGRKPIITLDTIEEKGVTILTIRDNGLGIDLEKHGKNIFGFRKTFHGNSDAHGFGLFITKNQIESMGGKIEVQSDVDKGTTFSVFINNANDMNQFNNN